MSCPFCGTINPNDSAYCTRCGVVLSGEPVKSMDVRADSEVCEACGSAVGPDGCSQCVEGDAPDVPGSAPVTRRRTAGLGAVLLFLGMTLTVVLRAMMPRVSELEAAAVNGALGASGLLTVDSLRYATVAAVVMLAIGALLLVFSAVKKGATSTAS